LTGSGQLGRKELAFTSWGTVGVLLLLLTLLMISGQLDNHLHVGDVVITISASGSSRNLIRAVELAKSRGVVTIGLLGFDGGILRSMVDIKLFVPSRLGAYGSVESIHLMLTHLITICLSEI
jgi:D-sedoheptulose 7-phosphate isomerase